MRRAVLWCLPLALFLTLVLPTAAGAEVIDYDPRTPPPQILSADEMVRYTQLQGTYRIPRITSDPSPNGQYVLLTGVKANTVSILDIDKQAISDIPASVWDPRNIGMASPLTWTSDTEGVFLTVHRSGSTVFLALSTLDFAKVTLTSQRFDLPTLEGRRFSYYTGLPLLHTTDGAFHLLGYTIPTGLELVQLAPQIYAPQTERAVRERQLLGTQPPTTLLVPEQGNTEVAALNLTNGELITIGALPPAANLGTALGSLSQRPGTDTVAYVVTTELSCSGRNVRGRQCRGGGMPTSHPLVQERLGLVPPEENVLVAEGELRITDLVTLQEKVIPNSDYLPGRFSGTLWTADGSLLLVASALPSVLDGRPYPIYGSPHGLQTKVFSPDGTHLRDWAPPALNNIAVDYEPVSGTRLMAMIPSNTDRHVYVFDAATPDAQPQAVFTGHGTLFSWELAGTQFVYSMGDVASPGDLYVAEARDVAGTAEQLTNGNAALLDASKITYQPITYVTSGGYPVEGVYIYPADWPFPPEEPKPVVVWQTGGPGGQMLNSWGTSVESPYTLLPNFGIPVFMVNGSGRTSNGAQFYSDMAEADNYGQRDIRDVKEGVDRLIEMGVADPAAVGVTGCSYGGYFTVQSMVEFPDLYKAGNTQCTLNDLIYEYNFGWSYTIGYLMGDSAAGNPAEYVKDSPVYRANEIKHPLLIFHGTQDFLPYEHMVNLHDQIEANGVPTRFLRVFGEGHGFGMPTSQAYAAQLQIQWFRQYLGIPAAHAVDRPLVWSRQPILPLPGIREVSR